MLKNVLNSIFGGKVDKIINPQDFELGLGLIGRFKIEHFRKFKKGYRKINEYTFRNGITNVGKNKILNVMFNDDTAIAQASWYIGLIDNSGFSALAAGDTMASHSGWTEFTSYTESTRVAWGPGTTSSQSVTNASPAQFDINGSGNVNGLFITSNSTKSGTTGTIWSSGSFSSVAPVGSGDQLKNSYSISC